MCRADEGSDLLLDRRRSYIKAELGTSAGNIAALCQLHQGARGVREPSDALPGSGEQQHGVKSALQQPFVKASPTRVPSWSYLTRAEPLRAAAWFLSRAGSASAADVLCLWCGSSVSLPELWSLGGTNCYFWVYFNKGCIAELVPC